MADTITKAIDALTSAAFIEGGVSIERTEEARERTEQRKRELIEAIAACHPQSVEAQAPAAVAWENFPSYLIDHCEGDVITEEGLQHALAAMLANPQYSATTPEPPATEDSSAGDPAEGEHAMGLARACELLSTTIGILMGYREKIAYTDRSPIAAAVNEAVEFLRTWPSKLPQAEVQAEPVALTTRAELQKLQVQGVGSPTGTMFHPDAAGFPVKLYTAPQAQPADTLDAENAKLKKAYQELGNMFHDQIVAQQAAWIEWQHGAGAEAGMQWIENGLCGPGHIPDEDEPYGTEAQAYFDANKSDPFPTCYCGRPSNSLWMGKGFCSNAHYNEHRAAMAAAQEGSKA